jgi:hypothetical protein
MEITIDVGGVVDINGILQIGYLYRFSAQQSYFLLGIRPDYWIKLITDAN